MQLMAQKSRMNKLFYLIAGPLNETDQQMCCDKHLASSVAHVKLVIPVIGFSYSNFKAPVCKDASLRWRWCSNEKSEMSHRTFDQMWIASQKQEAQFTSLQHFLLWGPAARRMKPHWDETEVHHNKVALDKWKCSMHQCIFVLVAKQSMKHRCG